MLLPVDTRRLALKLHLYLGLISGIFLVILGLTGSVMAFEGQLDHWLHPGRWYVTARAQALPESRLVQIAERRFAPRRVSTIHIAAEADIAQQISLEFPPGTNQAGQPEQIEATINQFDGSILSVHSAPTATESAIAFIHQFHLRLVSGEKGKLVISFVGLILVFEVPLGLLLWWRTKRATVKWKSSGFRISFDLHHLIGVYCAAFLFLAAATGVMIGFDSAQSLFYRFTHSAPNPVRTAVSTVIPGASPVNVDRVMKSAQEQMPQAISSIIYIPNKPRAAYRVILRLPSDPWSAVRGIAFVDQYTGKVLAFTDLYASPGYRAIRFNRALHTGDIFGMPSRIIVSLSSLALVVMVITGLVIWWKKLAI